MKSSHVLLIIGATLLVLGLIISGISGFAATKKILEGGAIIDSTSLEPGLGMTSVLKDLPAGRNLLLSLNSQPSDAPLSAVLTGPDGSPIGIYNVTKTPFTSSARTTEPGDHTLEIKNLSTRPVTINGALLNSPIADDTGGISPTDPGAQTLINYGIGVLAGVVLAIGGIVILIIGTIKNFRSRKAPESASPS